LVSEAVIGLSLSRGLAEQWICLFSNEGGGRPHRPCSSLLAAHAPLLLITNDEFPRGKLQPYIEIGHIPGAKGAIIAFEVSDLDAFVHKMKERAVSFVTEAFDTPVCRMAVIEDPDGNHITIHKRHA
jgi:hypothetical protein